MAGQEIELSSSQRRILHQVLAPFAGKIDLAGIFGSRATGGSRSNSDIDLVLYGTLDTPDVDRIWSLFEESLLAVKVDVCAYHLISHAGLKTHIDQAMLPLFNQQELAEPQEPIPQSELIAQTVPGHGEP